MYQTINKTIRKFIEHIIRLIFPQNPSEMQATEVVANIAKIRRDESDWQTKYPCPAYSFFEYRNEAVGAMIWRLKYRGDIKVADLFAARMYDQLCEELTELAQLSNFSNPILVAIPISKHKLRIRGFNQSVAICKALTAIDENRFFNHKNNVLYKIKDTKSQARVKDKISRLQNLKDSFLVKDKNLVRNKNIILLDDVLTTGSTLTEATNALKQAGAKNVIWVVIAH